jgi:hypothetical protein
MTGAAKAPHKMIFAMYVDATDATRVAATKITVAKIGPTALSDWPWGMLATNHRIAFNPLVTAKWPQ